MTKLVFLATACIAASQLSWGAEIMCRNNRYVDLMKSVFLMPDDLPFESRSVEDWFFEEYSRGESVSYVFDRIVRRSRELKCYLKLSLHSGTLNVIVDGRDYGNFYTVQVTFKLTDEGRVKGVVVGVSEVSGGEDETEEGFSVPFG